MVVLLGIYLLLYVVELFLMAVHWLKFKSTSLLEGDELPKVSVLVCARNEEHNLRDSLSSLLSSDYPFDRLEILVGNDNSEDNTESIIQEFVQQNDVIKSIRIDEEKDGLIAKGNVLSQLIDASHFEYQVIIDADMIVTKDWLKLMVSSLVSGNDMVSGYTQILKSNWIANLQFMDWQSVLFAMKTMADFIRPISILGNNMAFRKSTYDRLGGFRGLGPTDVEDLGLLQRFQKEGLKTMQLVEPYGHAYTKPQLTFDELLTQRCRWMNGVFTHHFVLGIPAFFARLWVVMALVMVWFNKDWALFIAFYGLWTNWMKSRIMTTRTKSHDSIFLISPIVISLLDTLALLRIIFIGKVSWKGRKH
ncbi:glycosyltransferase [Roseivirga sp. E12]|uniref:glycosyltransferase n=1 Tax=Roseivirga sp. E12 TaxID=2819237 RepID=UPI001F3DBDC3|nr:glycosyltransferase [Roseivirga sp. E12]